jgi:hypothetical protein
VTDDRSGDADEDDPVARVQTLFPGRIVAIETAEAPAGADASAGDAERLADDGEPPSSG